MFNFLVFLSQNSKTVQLFQKGKLLAISQYFYHSQGHRTVKKFKKTRIMLSSVISAVQGLDILYSNYYIISIYIFYICLFYIYTFSNTSFTIFLQLLPVFYYFSWLTFVDRLAPIIFDRSFLFFLNFYIFCYP